MSKNTILTAACGLTGLLLLGGCGGKSAPPAASESPQTATAPASSSTASTGVENAAPAATPVASSPAPAKNTGGKETKWIGTIPYDVFYDQPLQIASDATSISAASPVTGNAMASTTTRPAEPAPPVAAPATAAPARSQAGASQAVNWADIIPMPILLEESKLLRTRLTGNLQTVATFNKATSAISMDAAILAALASVAKVHPEQLPWKANAHFVRDLAAEVSSNAEGTGRAPFTKCKDPFDKLTTILDGGRTPEMKSDENLPFAEAVYVADMMKWIEPAFNGLKANYNTAARLKEDPATVERELRILAMLGTIMIDPSYDSAEVEGYQTLTKSFIAGANEAIVAAKSADISGYQAALNKIQTTCAECHQQYRGSSSAF